MLLHLTKASDVPVHMEPPWHQHALGWCSQLITATIHNIRLGSELRIIESLVLEGTFKNHLVQLPWNEQGHLRLDQGLVHSDSEPLTTTLGMILQPVPRPLNSPTIKPISFHF